MISTHLGFRLWHWLHFAGCVVAALVYSLFASSHHRSAAVSVVNLFFATITIDTGVIIVLLSCSQEDEIMALGMGAYIGVAQGAVFPPKFIHLTYK